VRSSILSLFLGFAILATPPALHAGPLDDLGFTALRTVHPELTGAGQIVAQPEAGPPYQVNPVAVGQPASLFEYYDTVHPHGGAGAVFTSASGHANDVGSNLYGATTGGAPGVQMVQNFDAGYFFSDIIQANVAISAPIVNQSFILDTADALAIAQANRAYDAYANAHGTLFINGLNNGTSTLTNAPASMYNGIAVGLESGVHSGRAQLVAPAGATSFATPYITAAAVVLRQAATLGLTGALPGTAATDARVLKVALLNGATKTTGWSHTSTDPLDVTYGAGVLNVENSFEHLAGGQHARSSSASITPGTIVTNATFTAPISATSGWDLASLSEPLTNDAVSHYFFDLSSETSLTFTATLTWNSMIVFGQNRISDFDLVLVNSTTGSILWDSSSTTQNVEHLFLTGLAGSKYDLQIILRDGAGAPLSSDTYALAWSWAGLTTSVPEGGQVGVLIGAVMVLLVIARTHRRRA
jgi:hypothetical protein